MQPKTPDNSSLSPRRRLGLTFGLAVPIGLLGDLIGLGGTEFRLPVLVGPLRYPARQIAPSIWPQPDHSSNGTLFVDVRPLLGMNVQMAQELTGSLVLRVSK